MMRKIDDLLRQNGWAGIFFRVGFELLFLLFIFQAGDVSVWIERNFFDRNLIIDRDKEMLLVRIFMCMIAVGFFVEAINAIKLLVASRDTKVDR